MAIQVASENEPPMNEERRPLLDAQTSVYNSTTASLNSVVKTDLNKPSKADLTWILLGLWSAVFLGALDGTIVATLLAPIGSYFNKAHQASYLGTSYLLSVCCFTPLYGRLSDILGRKGAMLLGQSLFGVGTVLCAMAPSMNFLIVARAIAGMGGGGVMTVSSIAVSDLIPLKQRGLYQGLTNILFGLGSGLGGPIGGFFNDRWGWRSAFLVQLPVLALSVMLVLYKVNIKLPAKFSRNQTIREKLGRIDWAGSGTLVVCIGSLLVGLSLKTGEEYPWSSLLVVGPLIGSAVFGVLFYLSERYWSKEPVMPLRLLVQRTPLFVCLSNFFISITWFSALYNVPLYFSAVRLQSATEAGLHLLPNAFAIGAGSLFAGWVIRRTGKLWSLTNAAAIMTTISCVFIALWSESTSDIHLWADIVPAGFGYSSHITSTLIALISSVSREDMAVATGISYLFRTTGQVLGVSLGGAILQDMLLRYLRQKIKGPGSAEIIERIRHSTAIIPKLDPETRQAAVDSYALALRAVFICQAAMAFVAFLCCLPIQEFPLPSSMEEQEENERRRSAAGSSSPNLGNQIE